jgi:hypothetical protein
LELLYNFFLVTLPTLFLGVFLSQGAGHSDQNFGCVKMKTKCLNTECEVCHAVGLMQIFQNNNGRIRYCRIRHYLKMDKQTKKPKFSYCPQSTGYAEKKLLEYNQQNLSTGKDFNTVTAKDDDHKEIGHSNADLKDGESSSKLENMGWSSSLVRTLALHAKGRRFKSGSAHHHLILNK